jgi:hypothetical protein
MSNNIKKKRGRKPKGYINNDNQNFKTESETLIFHLPINHERKSSDIFLKKNKKSNKNVNLLKEEIIKLKKENLILSQKLNKKKCCSKKIIKYHVTNYTEDTNCFWCKHKFCTPAIGLPENYNNNKFELIGHFCSFNCAKAYNLDLCDNNIWKRNSLLDFLYLLTYGEDIIILQAPHWKVLKDFGGNLNIKQFRDNFIMNTTEFIYLHPPLVTRKPFIEEINRTNTNFSNDNELVLKRSKPLKSNIHNIRTILGGV